MPHLAQPRARPWEGAAMLFTSQHEYFRTELGQRRSRGRMRYSHGSPLTGSDECRPRYQYAAARQPASSVFVRCGQQLWWGKSVRVLRAGRQSQTDSSSTKIATCRPTHGYLHGTAPGCAILAPLATWHATQPAFFARRQRSQQHAVCCWRRR